MAHAAIDRSRALYAAGETHQAYRGLGEAVFETGLEHEARTTLAELFPLAKDARRWIGTVLPALFSEDEGERRRAAKALSEAAALEAGDMQRDRIGRPDAMDFIVKALHSGDPKVAEAAAYATRLSMRYYEDPRAYQPLVCLLRDANPNTRRWAVEGVSVLGKEAGVELILPLLADSSEAVQTEVARMIMGAARVGRLSPPTRSQAVELMLGRFDSYATRTKNVILNAAREMGGKDVVERLHRLYATENEAPIRTKIAEVLGVLGS